jgi:RimK-like ATP-grasp domain
MILLWGVPSDPPLAAVERALRRDGIEPLFLDQRAARDTALHLEVGRHVTGDLTVFGETVQLDRIRAVYPRPYSADQLGTGQTPDAHAMALHEALSIWLDVTPAFVLNRPQQMAFNYSKPYQSTLIEAAGFRIPETLLTTDPDAARRFRDRHGAVIYKSISATRSIVATLCQEDELRLANVAWCPTQFQRRIGGFEVRVHIVGNELFASRIDSGADDYRYAALSGNTVEISSFELPQECADRCRSMVASMGFVIAGIDLRCEGGVWYCFEVNPSPAFTYYQQQTGQPISEAVARLLSDVLKVDRGPAEVC